MSKTNHGRGFSAPRFKVGQKTGGFIVFSGSQESIDGSMISANATVAPENSRSIARGKAGAKKYINSRRRRHDRDALAKMDFSLEP